MRAEDERKLELLDEYTTYEALQESLNIRIARYNSRLNRPELSPAEAELHLHAMKSLAELQRRVQPTDQVTIAALSLLMDGLEPELATSQSQAL